MMIVIDIYLGVNIVGLPIFCVHIVEYKVLDNNDDRYEVYEYMIVLIDPFIYLRMMPCNKPVPKPVKINIKLEEEENEFDGFAIG